MRILLVSALLWWAIGAQAQVKIGDNPNTINAASIFEMEDTTRGVLMPRMTTSQRDAIAVPPDGLQVYNITTRTIDIYRNSQWMSTAYTHPDDNLVYVYSLDDLPSPTGSEIELDATKMYIFKGIVDISPYYLELNGANLRGIDPSRDGVMSSVAGGVLRSTDVSVFMEHFVVIPASGNTKAYDFRDDTGTKFCNLFAGCSVIEIGIPSLGVGQVSGFEAITLVKNYWNCSDGVKVTDSIGKFACGYTFITNLTTGSGIEFLADLVINDIDLANNYFIYSGHTGVTVNSGATIDRGRMTTNMFRDVGAPLSGFDSYSIGWSMAQNTTIPDSRAYGYLYMNENGTNSTTSPNDTYVKVSGSTSPTTLQKFESGTSNRLTYKGKENITAKVFFSVTGKAPGNSANFTVCLAKNGTPIGNPHQSTGPMVNNQIFTLLLETEVVLSTDDYIEVFIKTTTSNSSLNVTDLQFRAVY